METTRHLCFYLAVCERTYIVGIIHAPLIFKHEREQLHHSHTPILLKKNQPTSLIHITQWRGKQEVTFHMRHLWKPEAWNFMYLQETVSFFFADHVYSCSMRCPLISLITILVFNLQEVFEKGIDEVNVYPLRRNDGLQQNIFYSILQHPPEQETNTKVKCPFRPYTCNQTGQQASEGLASQHVSVCAYTILNLISVKVIM